MCRYVWNGLVWVLQSHSCQEGGFCSPPARDGAYIGEEFDGPCFEPGLGGGGGGGLGTATGNPRPARAADARAHEETTR